MIEGESHLPRAQRNTNANDYWYAVSVSVWKQHSGYIYMARIKMILKAHGAATEYDTRILTHLENDDPAIRQYTYVSCSHDGTSKTWIGAASSASCQFRQR